MKKRSNKLSKIILSVLIISVIIVLYYITIDKSKYILRSTSGQIIKYKKETFINNVHKKSKFIVIQDGAYNKFPEFSNYTIKINKLYCKKWNYEYKFIEHDLSKMPPYWLKVNDVVEYIHKDYDYVVFLDLDACFIDFDISLDMLINKIDNLSGKKCDIYIGKDPPFSVIANTGTFIIKNSDFGKKFSKLWLSACMDNQNKITNKCLNWDYDSVNKKWSCPLCLWAGINYEQGVFNYIYELYKNNIGLLDMSFFTDDNINNKPFIYHAMSKTNDSRLNIFKNFYETINK
jgi:hypothetical protein